MELPFNRSPTSLIVVPSMVMSALTYSFSPSSLKVRIMSAYSSSSKVTSISWSPPSNRSPSPVTSLVISSSEASSEVMKGRTRASPKTRTKARSPTTITAGSFQF